MSRYQYRDCCPDCMTSTRPLIVVRGRRSSILALYECARCGRHWSCAWAEMPGGIRPVEVLPERR